MDIITLTTLVLYFLSLYVAILFLLIVIEKFENIQKEISKFSNLKTFPMVAIIIPAYNEEKNIKNAVESCFNLDYPKEKLQIIVVDDCSKDNTVKICESYEKFKNFKLIKKEKNTGKANSLNIAIKQVNDEFVCCLDADSEFEKNFLKNVIEKFNDECVVAVTSSMKVKETKNIIQKIQYIEYLFSIYMRKILSFMDAVYVTPGPGSIYRRKIFKEFSFDEKNLVEDMEIAMKIQKKGLKIENSVNAITYTATPEKIFNLYNQRLRWYGGYLENIFRKHRNLIFNKCSPNLCYFIIPMNFVMSFATLFFLFTFLFFTFIQPILNFVKKLMLGITTIDFSINFEVGFMFGFLLIFFLISIIVIFLSFKFSGEINDKRTTNKEKLKSALYFLLFYFLIYSIFFMASIFYIINRRINIKEGW
ncbi:MAG: glycosyltransferase [Candidatus Altarchaeum sp.]|nr:glycosyltransferase [Candidatus Altarchaeum sp.]